MRGMHDPKSRESCSRTISMSTTMSFYDKRAVEYWGHPSDGSAVVLRAVIADMVTYQVFYANEIDQLHNVIRDAIEEKAQISFSVNQISDIRVPHSSYEPYEPDASHLWAIGHLVVSLRFADDLRPDLTSSIPDVRTFPLSNAVRELLSVLEGYLPDDPDRDSSNAPHPHGPVLYLTENTIDFLFPLRPTPATAESVDRVRALQSKMEERLQSVVRPADEITLDEIDLFAFLRVQESSLVGRMGKVERIEWKDGTLCRPRLDFFEERERVRDMESLDLCKHPVTMAVGRPVKFRRAKGGPKKPPGYEDYATLTEAAEFLGIQRSGAHKALKRGRMRSIQLRNRMHLIPWEDVRAYAGEPQPVINQMEH